MGVASSGSGGGSGGWLECGQISKAHVAVVQADNHCHYNHYHHSSSSSSSTAVPMGPTLSGTEAPLFCRRVCGGEEGSKLRVRCDPAGSVFGDTLQFVGEWEKVAFRFAGSSNLAALRWLFVFGARPEACDSNGTTLLHAACRGGALSVVKDLVRRGLSVNKADNAGWTPLHISSCMGRADVSAYLIQCGASPKSRNLSGETPEDLCSSSLTKDVMLGKRFASQSGLPQVPVRRRGPSYEAGRAALEMPIGEDEEIGSESTAALHFEPFFVPRESLLSEPLKRDVLQKLGLQIFRRSPGHGLAFLVASGVVRDYPVEINSFLVRMEADPAGVGNFLGEEFPLSQTLRLEFLNSMSYLGKGVVTALQATLKDMKMPESWAKVDRLLRGVAHFWWRQHDEELAERKAEGRLPKFAQSRCYLESSGLNLHRSLLGVEGLHRLLFSTFMLWRYTEAGHEMPLEEWAQLNMGFETGGYDIPMHVQAGIYRSIVERGIGLQSFHLDGQLQGTSPLWSSDTARVVPAAEAHVQLLFAGRSQLSHGGTNADFVVETPRTLASLGGVPTAGRFEPFPESCDDDQMDATAVGNGLQEPFASKLLASQPSRHQQSVASVSALAQPKDAACCCSSDNKDAAFLRLCDSFLLFYDSSSIETGVPYAFASLKGTTIGCLLPASHSISLIGAMPSRSGHSSPVLGTRATSVGEGDGSDKNARNNTADGSATTWSSSSHSNGGNLNVPKSKEGEAALPERPWLELILLLGDGRFQALEAPRLELRFFQRSDFEAFAQALPRAGCCQDGLQQRPPLDLQKVQQRQHSSPDSGIWRWSKQGDGSAEIVSESTDGVKVSRERLTYVERVELDGCTQPNSEPGGRRLSECLDTDTRCERV